MNDLRFLHGLEPFRGLSTQALKQLLGHMERRAFKPGEIVLAQGDPGDAMFVIRDGRADVRVRAAEGPVRFETHLGPGDVFGEMALLTGEARNADVCAASDTRLRCLVARRSAVQALVREHSDVALFLTKLLEERLRTSLQHIGQYRILGVLGRGGMATVYEGYHPLLERAVAIKVLSHVLACRPGFVERFQTEAKTLASLRHPGIVRLYDAQEGFGTWYLVMERLRGSDLRRVLKERGRLGPDETREIVLQLLRALQHAHEHGVVHRDVKPANVFLEPGGRAKLVDFGIAEAVGSNGMDADGDVMCSPDYTSPEVFVEGSVGPASDLYALGVMAFRMLAGRLPFVHENAMERIRMHVQTPLPDLREIVPDLPDDLHAFVARAAKKKPAERFASCSEAIALLAAAQPDAAGAATESLSIELRFAPRDRERLAAPLDAIRALREDHPWLSVEFEDDGSGGPS